jgi:hypothetical protein
MNTEPLDYPIKLINRRRQHVLNCSNCTKEIYRVLSKTYKYFNFCTSCATSIKNKEGKGIYRLQHNTNYFRDGSLQSCYWAGFIASDGCVSDKGIFSLKLNEKDEGHLIQFLQDSESSSKVLNSGSEDRKRITFTAHEWVSDLKTIYNITPRKSLTLEPPNLINEEMIKAFIIGYIDGDGTICFLGKQKYLRLGIVSTFEMCSWIKSYFDQWVDPTRAKHEIQRKVTKNSSEISEYTVYGKRAAKLINLLKEVPVHRLKRKWEQELLEDWLNKIN